MTTSGHVRGGWAPAPGRFPGELGSTPGPATILAAVLLALAPAVAHAQYGETGMDSMPSGKRPSFKFVAPAAGDYATLTAATGQTITCTRASTATYLNNAGTRVTAAANRCRVENAGLVVETGTTNNLLNSNAPVTQTTASLGTNSGIAYTGWMEGSGSLAFTTGTATATGLPCTATAGSANDCHFTVTGAGTVVATVGGTVTAEQLEPHKARTALVVTAGTVASRANESVSFPKPAGVSFTGGNYSVSVTASYTTDLWSAAPAEFNSGILSTDQSLTALLRVNSPTKVQIFSDSSGADDAFKTIVTGTLISNVKYAASKLGSSLTLYAAGSVGSPSTLGTQQTEPTAVFLGSARGTNSFLNGHIASVCLAATATGCPP